MLRLLGQGGAVEKEKSDSYFARELQGTGMELIALLDEFHTNHMVYSSGVERLVCHLIIIETTLEKEKKEKGSFYGNSRGFLGIGKRA